MGEKSRWQNCKTDVSVAKNYLTESELASLGRIVNAYLDLAEDRAKRHIPMTMEDWAQRLDKFLEADDRNIFQNSGKISDLMAKKTLQKVNLKDTVSCKTVYLNPILTRK